MKHILKYFKKLRLLYKYKLTYNKQQSQVYLLMYSKDNDFKDYIIHQIHCELRCYSRLKKL